MIKTDKENMNIYQVKCVRWLLKDSMDADMIYLLPTIVSSRRFPVHPRNTSI